MKVSIMQPYFFPYLGYFQLIKNADRFILFDDVQYIRHGWINRNRTLKPVEGWQYIVAPIQKHKRDDLIKDIQLKPGEEWKQKIFRQLEHYKKKAPYYEQTLELLNSCFQSNESNVTRFNANCLNVICQHLEIPFEVEISSEMNFDYSDVNDAGEWALRISEQLNASEYVNPSGGAELFSVEKFRNANIQLSFLNSELLPYSQKRDVFEAGLSILDVILFNGLENTKAMLDSYNIERL